MSVASMTGPTAWTSLEVAKLLVQSLVPLAIFAFGVLVARRANRGEEAAWQTQRGSNGNSLCSTAPLGTLTNFFVHLIMLGIGELSHRRRS